MSVSKVDLKLHVKTVIPFLFVYEELNWKVGGMMLVLYCKGLLLYIKSLCFIDCCFLLSAL